MPADPLRRLAPQSVQCILSSLSSSHRPSEPTVSFTPGGSLGQGIAAVPLQGTLSHGGGWLTVQNWVMPSVQGVGGQGHCLHTLPAASGPVATMAGEQSGVRRTVGNGGSVSSEGCEVLVRCAMVMGCSGHAVGELDHLVSTDSLPMGSSASGCPACVHGDPHMDSLSDSCQPPFVFTVSDMVLLCRPGSLNSQRPTCLCPSAL